MLYIILPAYNEAESLTVLLPKIKEVMVKNGSEYQVILINDGSKDSTLAVARQFKNEIPIEIINHKYNRGLGETIRDGFEYAAEISTDDDIIVRFDCDDTHDPVYVPEMIRKINQGYDVVIASRFVNGGGQKGLNLYRKVISSLANLFMKIFFPIKGLKEYSSGFRAYRASLIKKAIDIYGNGFLQLKGIGFSCTLEKIVKLNILGAKFGEIPFVLKYDQKRSESKMVSSITTLGYFILVILYHWPWGGWKQQYRSINK